MPPRKPVVVVPYDDSWPAMYERERHALADALGTAALAIHHVGSTSLPGPAAKPVIDVLVEATALEDVDAATPALERKGYRARGEHGIPGRRYFVLHRDRRHRVHVHAFTSGHEQIAAHLAFRDYLRAHPDEAARYGELKLALAARFADDKRGYQEAKAGFVRGVLDSARAWARTRA